MTNEKITKSKLYKQLVLKCEMFFYPVVLPLGVYFVYFTGGFEGDNLTHLIVGALIGALSVTPISLIFIYRKISEIMIALESDKRNTREIKIKIFHLPWVATWTFFIRWITGGAIALIYLSITADLTATQVIPFILIVPLLALINFSMGYFNAENGIEGLLSIPEIRDTWLDYNDFKGLSFTMRIIMLVVPVAAIPTIVLGYLVYLLNSGKLTGKDISLYIILILVLSAATIALLTYFMMTNIKRTVNTLKNAIEDVKDGRLDNPGVPMINSSEIGFISQSANSLISKLHNVITMVQQSTNVVSEMSVNIQEASVNLSQATTEQASGVEEISSTIEEILATVSQNTENAGRAEKLADNSYQLAEKGNNVMDQAVQTINEIKKSSEKISDIIGIINTIAFQTNILALNAAVEAARAGEHGRSFAVVAAEVRSLAQRSGASSKEIEALIKTSVSQVFDGTRLAQESGKSLKEIFDAIVQVRQMILEISTASREQNAGLKQISDAVTQTDLTTQQNAAAAEELSGAAETLRSNASELKDAVKYFTL